MNKISPVEGVSIDLHVSPEFHMLFSRAAEIAGVSLSAFITESARQRAMELVEQHDRIVLNNQARDMLLKAMNTEQTNSRALSRAASRFAAKI